MGLRFAAARPEAVEESFKLFSKEVLPALREM
jgi:hypothetical protein